MKLLAFVLLGFLAHSCSGNCQMSQEKFTKNLENQFRAHWIYGKHENFTLPPINVADVGNIFAIAHGLSNVKIEIKHNKKSEYSLSLSANISLSSTSFGSPLSVSIKADGKLELSVKEGCFNLGMVEGSLKVSISALKKINLNLQIGSVLGNVLEKLHLNFMSKCTEHLKIKITEICKSFIMFYNNKNKASTEPHKQFGITISASLGSLTSSNKSLNVPIILTFTEPGNKESKRVHLGKDHTELPLGVDYVISISKEFIETYSGYAFAYTCSNYKKNVPQSDWSALGLAMVKGNVSIFASMASPPKCKIQPTGSSINVSLKLELTGGDKQRLMEANFNLHLGIGINGKGGQINLEITKTSTSNIHVKGSDKNNAESISKLVTEVAKELKTALQCSMRESIPIPDIIPVGSQSTSQCTPFNTNEFQCTSGKQE